MRREPTPKEQAAIAEVHELAGRRVEGSASLAEVRAATSGKQRWLATRFTRPDDPRFGPLMALLDALIADQADMAQTEHGLFERDDLIAAEIKIEREDGCEVIVFPDAYIWLSPPDPEKGIEGVRGPARYRPKNKRGPIYSTFSRVPSPRDQPREREWWEAEED